MDINLRRRAVMTGLRPFLEDQELYVALALWEQQYASQPVFALSGLVAQCCSSPELKRQRGLMLRALIAAMDLPSDQLLPDPGPPADIQGPASALKSPPAKPQPAGADGKTQTFMLLMGNIQAICEPGLRAIMRLQLQTALETLGLERQQKQAMWAWLAGQGAGSDGLSPHAVLGQSYALKPLQSLINQAYVVMCEQLGPVKADQYLARAVQGTQAKAQTGSFSVHELL